MALMAVNLYANFIDANIQIKLDVSTRCIRSLPPNILAGEYSEVNKYQLQLNLSKLNVLTHVDTYICPSVQHIIEYVVFILSFQVVAT